MASFSDSYKTMMYNFKVNKGSGKFEEILLISRISTKMIDGKNSEVMNYQIISGRTNSVPLEKFTTYTTKSCKCVWYTICIKNDCEVQTHYVPRAYTSSELSNLETAMRFRTYQMILTHCYKYKDEIDFSGLSSFAEYVDNMKLPPRVNQI